MLKKSLYLISAVFFIVLYGCAIKVKVNPASIEQSKETINTKYPYRLNFKVNKNQTLTYYEDRTYTKYIFNVGNTLLEAINNYLNPYFDQNADDLILLDIYINSIECKEVGFVIPSSVVETDVDVIIYKNYLILYEFHVNGYSKVKATFPIDSSLNIATSNAIIDAVQKIPNEVISILNNPEKYRKIQKDEINNKIKNSNASVFDYIMLANLSFETENYNEAIAAANMVNDIARYLILGDIYIKQKRYNKADSVLNKYVKEKPNDWLGYKKLSVLYNNYKINYLNDVKLWQKAIQNMPESYYCYTMLGIAYANAGKFDDAINATSKAIDLLTITGTGIKINMLKDYPVVSEIIENTPASKEGLQNGDKIILINNQSTKKMDSSQIVKYLEGLSESQVSLTIKRGTKIFQKNIIKDETILPEAATDFGIRSIVYSINGDLSKSFKDANKAFSLNPDNGWAKQSICLTYILNDTMMNKVFELLDTTSNFDKFLMSLSLAKANNYDKAVSVYLSIPDSYRNSNSAIYKYVRGILIETLKSYAEKKKQEILSLEANEHYKEAIVEYKNYLEVVDEDEAKSTMQHISELITLKPYLFALTEQGRESIIKAESYVSEGNFEKAIESYKKALTTDPFFPAIYKSIAVNYAEIKNYNNAINYMNIYINLYPNAPDVRGAKDKIYEWKFKQEKTNE